MGMNERVKKLSEEIRKLSPDEVNKRTDAARAYGQKLPASNGKTATIGYCWGGAASFRYATHQPELNAAVVYYGSAPRTGEGGKEADVEGLKKIKAPVLGLYGGADTGIPIEAIERMRSALKAAAKPSEIVVYPGAPHGFHADYRESYRPKAAQDAWKRMLEWFKEHGVG